MQATRAKNISKYRRAIVRTLSRFTRSESIRHRKIDQTAERRRRRSRPVNCLDPNPTEFRMKKL